MLDGTAKRTRPLEHAWLQWPAFRFLFQRLANSAIVLLAASALVFFCLHLAPGDVADALVGDAADDAAREAARIAWGLDRPIWEQYLSYLGKLLQGDLGYSFLHSEPVTSVIRSRLIPTVQLTGLAAIFAVVMAVSVTILTGTGRPRIAAVSSLLELILISTPSFWLGILLIYFVSFKLNLMPIVGTNTLAVLILPALTLGLRVGGELIQIMREAINQALLEPFTLSARARGITDLGYSFRHGLKHASLPAITVGGWIAGNLLTGTFLIEVLFGRSGVGTLTVSAVLSRDTPLVMGVALVAAAVYVMVSTLVDVAVHLIDPRLRNT